MNNSPRQTLRQIIAKYGNDVCGDARRCEALLKDLCGEYRREINVLVNALEERVPLDLLAAGKTMPRELLLNRLAKRLEDNLGLTTQASDWAVNSWAFALGLLTEAEVAEKEEIQTETLKPLPPKTIPPKPTSQSPKIQNPYRQSQPPSRSPQNQPRTPKVYPPIARTPVNVPMPLPKSVPQRSGSNVNVPQKPTQTNNPVSNQVPKRQFGKFFGCLFIFFLLIVTGTVLFFGVPYAINVMRETQQSEPARFPPQ